MVFHLSLSDSLLKYPELFIIIIIIIIIIFIIIYSYKVFHSINWCFLLEFQWQKNSPSLQDSSRDSGRSQ